MYKLVSTYYSIGQKVGEIEVRSRDGSIFETYCAYEVYDGCNYVLSADSWLHTGQSATVISSREMSRDEVFMRLLEMARDYGNRLAESKRNNDRLDSP